MKTPAKISENLDDLVFLNRNKEYGAYQIRRQYAAILNRATAFSIILLLTALGYPLIASYYQMNKKVLEKTLVQAEMIRMEPPPLDVPPPPPPPAEALEAKTRFIAPVITDDTATDINALNVDDLLKLAINTIPGPSGLGNDSIKTPDVIEIPKEPELPPLIVEEMPYYDGGDEALLRFLSENLHYPQMAKETGIQGTVYINFYIDAEGKVSNVKLIRGIGGGCDEEAMRVIKMMKGWNAGKQGGKPVKVQYNIPVKFTLG